MRSTFPVCVVFGIIRIMSSIQTLTRFWNFVDKRSPDQCWMWTRGASHGYGVYGRKPQWRTHRLAYTLTHGPIPDSLFVCHKCDNTLCCNPAHLFLGTALDNVRDCINKRRRAKKKGHYNTGSMNSHAKLSVNDAADITRRVAAGERQVDLAREYQVDKSTIWRLVRNRTWTHTPIPT
jgi:hypothetical protein